MSDIEDHTDNNQDKDCEWTPNAKCIPKDYDYKLPKEYEKPLYPVPKCCKKFNLDNTSPTLITKEGSKNDYIYVDGRKFLVDKSDLQNCYVASYWLKPGVREKCDTNYEEDSDISLNKKVVIDEACFREIPTESGYNTSKTVPFNETDSEEPIRALDCNKALRPAQKTETAAYVTKEANYWLTRSKKNKMLYNTKSILAGNKYQEMHKISKEMDSNNNRYDSINNQLQQVKSEILSRQRQIEISNDETLKINDRIYYLRSFLIYIFLLCVILILGSILPNTITGGVLVGLITILTIVLAIWIVLKLYSTRNRHPARWPLAQWKPGDIPGEKDKFPKSKHQKDVNKEEHIIVPEQPDNHQEYIPEEEDQKIITAENQKYKCFPISPEKEDEESSILEEEIKKLDKLIGQCDIENRGFIEKRDKLKTELCHQKNIPDDQCHSS